jgi:putative chitobiose transport system permease protein
MAVLNSVFVAGTTVLLGLVINGFAGYALAVLRFPGRNVLFFFIVLTFLIPFEAIAIPLYTVVRAIGWLDTYQGLIGPGVANALAAILCPGCYGGHNQRLNPLLRTPTPKRLL